MTTPLEKALEYSLKFQESFNRSEANTAQCVFFEEGRKDEQIYFSGACHADMRWKKNHGQKSKYIISYIQGGKQGHLTENDKFYYHWLLNESPMSSVFVLKDVDEVDKYGFIVDSESPYNLMMCGLIATRHVWEAEKRFIIKSFCKLHKMGLNKNMAFLLASGLKVANGQLYPITASGHSVINFWDIEDPKSFVLNKPINKGKPYTNKSVVMYKVKGCWTDPERVRSHRNFSQFLRGKGEAKVLNPFRKTFNDIQGRITSASVDRLDLFLKNIKEEFPYGW